MKEYMNHPEETAQTLRRHADGLTWVYTGDLGTMDAEGFVYFRGRAKRMIVSVRLQRLSRLSSRTSSTRTRCVQMSCVIGIPDAYKMQKVKAFVKLAAGIPANDATRQALMSLLLASTSPSTPCPATSSSATSCPRRSSLAVQLPQVRHHSPLGQSPLQRVERFSGRSVPGQA